MIQLPTMPLLRILLLSLMMPVWTGASQGQANRPDAWVLDDFESYKTGGLPVRWSYLHDRTLQPLTEAFMREKERFTVVQDGRNKVLRVYTHGEAVHLTMLNERPHMDWDLGTHPVLAWDWRANKLPPGAREDNESLNDSAAAIYVVFSFDGFIVKRPKTIKYVYSSTLPEGTVVSYGKLKVIVVSSATMGQWQRVERNVADDYRMVFGGEPPEKPVSIRLWGDSDNTGSEAEADFDNIRLKPDTP
jgi:hypothetical protein